MPGLRGWWEPGGTRRSLRSELLFNLAFLAAAALFLALWTASIFQLFVLPLPAALALLGVLVVLDLLVFVALGSYLVDRLVLRPLASTTAAAEAIAAGDYERRVAEGHNLEVDTLARALNRLTGQLLENQRRLADNVRSLDETNRRLNEAQGELVQAEKLASIGRLAAGVAHEIGNPLGALLGYVEIVRRRGPSTEILDGMEREARRIDAIVRGLLDYARPGPARREVVDVNASIRRVVDLLRSQGRLEGIELSLQLADDLPMLEGVPHRMDQMFVNILANADAAMEGEGRLTIVTRRDRYTPAMTLPSRRGDDPPGIDYSHLRRLRHGSSRESSRLRADTEIVKIVIADSGPGIPQENIDAIFDPFFTTKAPGHGTGLGLAIVAATVDELGGRIDVSSAEESGATFTIFLPVPTPTE